MILFILERDVVSGFIEISCSMRVSKCMYEFLCKLPAILFTGCGEQSKTDACLCMFLVFFCLNIHEDIFAEA